MALNRINKSMIDPSLVQDVENTKSQLGDTHKLFYYVSVEDKQFNGNIQAAIDATPDYATLYFGYNKTYNIENLQIRKPIFIEMNGARIFANGTSNNSIFNVKGTREATNYILTTPVNRHDKTITLTESPSDITEGDLIVLTDDLIRFADNTPNINTEIHEVETVDIANKKITLRDYVRLPKGVSTTSNVYKINPVQDVVFNNLNMEFGSNKTGGSGISIEYGRNVRINDVKIKGGLSPCVNLKYTYLCYIDGFTFTDPLSLAGGFGYGVRIEKTNGFSVKRGYGKGMRHTVDCHNAFDGVIDDVISVKNSSTPFVISHNGFDSDITLRDCRAYNVKSGSYGFQVQSQGVPDSYSISVYGIKLFNCEAQIEDANYASAIRFQTPVKECVVDTFKAVCADGKPSLLNNAGIGCLSVENDILIKNFTSIGFRDGISFYDTTDRTQTDKNAKVTIRDVTIKNAQTAILMTYGKEKNAIIENVKCDTISGSALRLVLGSWKSLSIDDVFISNSPSALAFFQLPISHTEGTFGKIGNIKSNNTSKVAIDIIASKKFTTNEMYLNRIGDCIFIASSSAVTMATYPLQDGIVEGENIILYNSGTNNITVPASAKLITISGSAVVLSTKQKLSLLWLNGAWREV